MTDRRGGFSVIEVRPERLPLFREPDPPPPFPVEALGPLRPAVEAIHDRTQAHISLCANSVLAVASLAACAHADVLLPFGQKRPTACLFATVAESGERKTTADHEALTPVREFEREQREAYSELALAHRNELEAWRVERERVLAEGKKDGRSRAAIKTALDALGAEPEPPPHPMVLIDDLTSEGVVRHLEKGRPWAGLFASEGGVIVGGHAWRDEARMGTLAQLNKLWDGQPIRRVRSVSSSAFLPGRRIVAHLMLQPDVADALFADRLAHDIGTISRFLAVAPPSLAGTRLFREPKPESAPALAAYCGRIAALLKRPARHRENGGGLDPVALPLSAEARRRWIEFHDWAEAAAGRGGEWEAIRPWASKAAEHAARLATVLAVYESEAVAEVGVDAVEAGIALALHYGAEALRLAGHSAISTDLRLAAEVLQWWQTRPPDLHAKDLYRLGPARVRDRGTALRVMSVLVDHGHAIALPEGTVVGGAPRRHAWRRVDA